MARIIQYPSGNQEISILDSYIYWKKEYPEMGTWDTIRDENGNCPMCTGFGEGQLNGEPIRCLCQLVGYNKDWREAIATFGSPFEKVEWESMKKIPDGDITQRAKYQEIMGSIHRWRAKLHKWIVLSGLQGTGKSYILQAIATEHEPYAMYVNSADLEQRVFAAMHSREDGETIPDIVDALSYHPILLLDDIGAEYASPFPKSVLRNVIDRRYRFWRDYITVVSTNLVSNDLAIWDARMADRLLDVNKSNLYIFTHKSWRRKA